MSLLPAVKSFVAPQGRSTVPVSNFPPVDRLPDEVLVYTFSVSLQDSEPLAASQETLLFISHVCSRWRRLALSAGELWACLVISFPASSQELARAKTWLDRSNSYPLHIIIDVRYPDWDFDEDSHPVQWLEMQAIMGIVLPYAKQWQKMNISADNWTPLHVFLHYTQNIHPPHLRKLVLRRCNPYFSAPGQRFFPPDSRVFIPLFGGRELQELCAVELEGVHVDWARSMGLAGLTSLSFGYHASDVLPSLQEFRDMLSSSPELRSLTIMGWGPSLDKSDPNALAAELNRFHGTIRLPRLRHLGLGVMVPSYSISLLSLFVLPSLEILIVDGITRYDERTLTPPDLSSIFDFLAGNTTHNHSSQPFPHSPFLTRPVSSLEELTLKNLTLDQAPLRRFLQKCQELRALTIQNCSESTLAALVPDDTSTELPCHQLELLCIEACDTDILINSISHRRETTLTSSPAKIIFQYYSENSAAPLKLLPDTEARFAELGIQVQRLHSGEHHKWWRFEADDSEDLVAAILDERWEVPGALAYEDEFMD